MPRPLTEAGLSRLKKLSDSGDRTGYYEVLGQETGDPYAALALGVVKLDKVSGRVARNFAVEVGRRYCRTIDDVKWRAISEDLMRADLGARVIATNQVPSQAELTWNVIRDYHVAVFTKSEYGLPAFAWTAWIPLEIQSTDEARAALWHDMLSRTILPVGVETVGLVIAGIPGFWQKLRGIYDLVLPTIHWHPPLATGNDGTPAFQACMDAMTRFQLEHGAELSRRQHYALFYLDVLSTNGADIGTAIAIAPTAAWRNLLGRDVVVPVPTRPELRVTPGGR